jgi:hypothetical protein
VACRHCQQTLHGDDPQPLRHQVWDVPPVRPIVTEYRAREESIAVARGLAESGQEFFPAGKIVAPDPSPG